MQLFYHETKKMAACFGPLPPSKKQFDVSIPSGRPPRKDFSYRPPRVQRTRAHNYARNADELYSKRFLSSTYRSFRESNEDDICGLSSENHKNNFRRSHSLKNSHINGDSSENNVLSLYNGSTRIRRNRRNRNRSKTLDGYCSDTTLLPNIVKPFLSSFKTDDNEFETALLSTMREKSKSSQNLAEVKKPGISPRLKPVPIPSADMIKFDKERTVTFSKKPTVVEKRCKYSVLKSELPTLKFEDLKNAAKTRHPRSLYSTTRYKDLHITIFCGNECVNPPRIDDGNYLYTNKTESTNSLRLQKNSKGIPSLNGMVRSQSEGNLAGNDGSGKEAVGNQGGISRKKYLRALSGSWRNLLNLGGMSRPSKAAPMAKKVAPPAVPEVFRHSGSSFGSAGYASSEDGFIPLPPPDGQSSISDRSDLYGVSGKSPSIGGQFNYQSFTFPGKGVYYHHQQSLQEDQGIDMTQSPGRDSPGSSGSGSGSGSRHSTASLDSGRASGSHFHGPRAACSTLSSSPRCSISSSSIVSSENGPPGARVERLMHQGVPVGWRSHLWRFIRYVTSKLAITEPLSSVSVLQDQDVVHAWLQDLHFEEYFTLFVSAGYDMPTISKMTPEDLTAIGIKKPNHRKKLKAEIAQLNISDGLPDYIPDNMEEWLTLLRLEEYITTFRQQGYETIEDVTQLAWEDLEEAGVVKLGHQKRLMLAIKRVKDIRAGKRFSNLPSHSHITQAELHTPSPGSIESSYSHTLVRPFRHPWDIDASRQIVGYTSPYCPDIVPIKIRGGRGKSLESLEDGERTGTHHTFNAENTATFYFNNNIQLQSGGWRRSYEDGDITPTNEATVALHEGGGTLPRPRGLVRPRPVAKIPATRNTTSHYFEKPSYNIYDMNAENLKKCDLIESDLSSCDLQEKCVVPPSMAPIAGVYDYKYRYSVAESNPGSIHNSSVLIHNSPGMRRRPPSPPKRQNSHSSDIQTPIDCNISKDTGMIQQTTIVELHPHPSHPSVPLPTFDVPLPSSELSTHLETLHIGWRNETAEEEEQQLIAALAQQTRNGSDASFKSSSSTESDSLPFANENAGTIKQRARCQTNEFQNEPRNPEQEQEPADVLSDIGNMLANLTDELDAMLEEEKRQGLNLD